MELTKEYLEREYVQKRRSSPDIAREVGMSPQALRARMRKLGIAVRCKSEAKLGTRQPPSKELLKELYIVQHLSVRRIAEKTGVSAKYIKKALREFGLHEPRRKYAGNDSLLKGAKRDPNIARKALATKKKMGIRNGPIPKPIETRFWPKVDKTEDCWVWCGTKNNHGYGMLLQGTEKRLAHRISWELHYDVIPKGKNVLHRCDNPACVRPDHLFLGSMRDNSVDMAKKSRWKNQHATRLTADDVERVRELYKTGALSQQVIADIFGVHQGTISRIVLNKCHSAGGFCG